ncbi:MAG: carboxypeptidase regulatory-like domain-containing protein [Hymenobacter sp.]
MVAILLASPALSYGQAGSRPAGAAPTPTRAAGRLSGTITDAANGKPVSYATVNVINPATNSPVNGGVAGDDGKFVLPGIPAGTYRVEISFLGYANAGADGDYPGGRRQRGAGDHRAGRHCPKAGRGSRDAGKAAH